MSQVRFCPRVRISSFRIVFSKATPQVPSGLVAHSWISDPAHVLSCRFVGNDAQIGGALARRASGTIELEACDFEANAACGAAIGFLESDRALVECEFIANVATAGVVVSTVPMKASFRSLIPDSSTTKPPEDRVSI